MPEYNELEEEISKYKEAELQNSLRTLGNEFIEYPYQDQIQFAHYLVDIGYNLIIGMHPHGCKDMKSIKVLISFIR